jgi:hypothetical protein
MSAAKPDFFGNHNKFNSGFITYFLILFLADRCGGGKINSANERMSNNTEKLLRLPFLLPSLKDTPLMDQIAKRNFSMLRTYKSKIVDVKLERR